MEYDHEIKRRHLQARSPEVHQDLFGFLKATGIKPFPQNITESQTGELDKELLRVMGSVRKSEGLTTKQRRAFIDYLKWARSMLKKMTTGAELGSDSQHVIDQR